MTQKTEIPIHKWTDKDGLVLIVKCVNQDMTSHGGFVWPKSGPVKPDKWSRDNSCESGGLFGWAWGMQIGNGKDPNANLNWLVFSAKPENVIDIDGKVKVVPGESGELPNVIYCGTQAGAMKFTMDGRIKWVENNSNGSASATGYMGSASATGDYGSASAAGICGSASAAGICGSASATGDWGSASAAGDCGSASATGYRGSASATGEYGSASAAGDRGSASATGDWGSASAAGDFGSASAAGDFGSASATGSRGSASATGYKGSASAMGNLGIASVSNSGASIEVGPNASGVIHSSDFKWTIHIGSVLIVRWEENGLYPFAFLDSSKLNVKEGEIVQIVKGKLVK